MPDSQTRVLMCIPRLELGGAERQVRQMAPGLALRGIAIALFSRVQPGDVDWLERLGVGCFPITSQRYHDPTVIIELRKAIIRHQPDIIHTVLPQMDIIGGIAALVSGRKWVLSERSTQLAYKRRFKPALRRWLGRRADAIVANSAEGLKVWSGHSARYCIPNTLDIRSIQSRKEGALDGCDRIAGRSVIISIARLSPEKRLERLLLAACLLKDRIPNLLVVILGEGGERPALEACIDRLGLRDVVLLPGYRRDVWQWLNHASVFVSTSQFEGHPNAVLEAAAAGIPQVLSDIPGHREAVGDDGALFVDVEDGNLLANAIEHQLTNREVARKFAAQAMAAVEKLTQNPAADQLIGIYHALLARRRQP